MSSAGTSRALGPALRMPEIPALGPFRGAGDREVPLVELLDRLLDTGVALSGDLVISVADVDLVWLGLRAVLQGIDEPRAGMPLAGARPGGSRRSPAASPAAVRTRRPASGPAARVRAEPRGTPGRLGIDPDHVERGLVQLVLTVVELVRELLERQALRRVDADGLSESQVEELGRALLKLEERMAELKDHFGFSDDDLRPRLGAVTDLD